MFKRGECKLGEEASEAVGVASFFFLFLVFGVFVEKKNGPSKFQTVLKVRCLGVRSGEKDEEGTRERAVGCGVRGEL